MGMAHALTNDRELLGPYLKLTASEAPESWTTGQAAELSGEIRHEIGTTGDGRAESAQPMISWTCGERPGRAVPHGAPGSCCSAGCFNAPSPGSDPTRRTAGCRSRARRYAPGTAHRAEAPSLPGGGRSRA
jgi:hypothetical protein